MPAERPAHLPEFKSPPLNEVFVGVQFVPAPNYQQILAGEVWNLYKSDFPHVEEQPPLQPNFETFGVPQSGGVFNFNFVQGATHDRFWFLTEDKQELIQFQPDRLIHNWRKVEGGEREYPRFETMIAKFEVELRKLSEYFAGLGQSAFEINQCEISYINHIVVDEAGGLSAESALNLVSFGARKIEHFDLRFAELVTSDNDEPIGRLHCRSRPAFVSPSNQRVQILELIVRGAPAEGTIDGAITFLKMGRERVVKAFAEVTSEAAQKIWERTQ